MKWPKKEIIVLILLIILLSISLFFVLVLTFGWVLGTLGTLFALCNAVFFSTL